MKLATTSFAASSLFGFKSIALILVDTSIDRTMSTPYVVESEYVSTETGRASATITKAIAINRRMNGIWMRYCLGEVGMFS